MIELYKGDCLEVMDRLIADGVKVDAVITSPPYNAKKEYEKELSLSEYKKFAEKWVGKIEKLLSDNGVFWLNVGYMKLDRNETLPLTYLYHEICNLPMVQEIVWHYGGGMSYKLRYTHRTERWQWYAKNPNTCIFNLDEVRDLSLNKTNDKRNHKLGKNPTDYWHFDRVNSGTGKVKEKTEHPCQFSEKMVTRIVKANTNENQIVLDPFMGSGTTGVVCKKLNRNFIGIELDDKYFEIAEGRMNE